MSGRARKLGVRVTLGRTDGDYWARQLGWSRYHWLYARQMGKCARAWSHDEHMSGHYQRERAIDLQLARQAIELASRYPGPLDVLEQRERDLAAGRPGGDCDACVRLGRFEPGLAVVQVMGAPFCVEHADEARELLTIDATMFVRGGR